MSKALRITLISIFSLVAAATLILVGFNIGRSNIGDMHSWGSLHQNHFDHNLSRGIDGSSDLGFNPAHRSGMRGDNGSYYDMHDGHGSGYGMMDGSGYGMMDGSGYGMIDGSGYGMMDNLGSSGVGEPISISAAEEAIKDFLTRLDNDQLIAGEIMIFDNHAYAQIIEEETGIGAMELLINPVTLEVQPEFGPNMMWNTRYSPMGRGMMGSMIGQSRTDTSIDDFPIDAEEAVENAQQFLDTNLPGVEADVHADPFYGYFTIHTVVDGKTNGMLSVNAFTGDVFIHTWHGELLEMSAE
jgi:hypothetical protein